MNYPVQSWTRKPQGSDVVPGAAAFAAELECGHVNEHHGPEPMLLETVRYCGVCAHYAKWALEIDAELAQAQAEAETEAESVPAEPSPGNGPQEPQDGR